MTTDGAPTASELSDTEVADVELLVLSMAGVDLDPQVVEALRAVVQAGHIALLDVAVVIHREDDSVVVLDDTDELAQLGLADLSPPDHDALLSEDDLALLAEDLAAGQAALVAVCDEAWITRLVRTASAGGGSLALLAHVDMDDYASARGERR